MNKPSKPVAVVAAAILFGAGAEACTPAQETGPNFRHSNQSPVVQHLAGLVREQYDAAAPGQRFLDHNHAVSVSGELIDGPTAVLTMRASRLRHGLPIPRLVVSVQASVAIGFGNTVSVELARGNDDTWDAYRQASDGLLEEAIDQKEEKRQRVPGGPLLFYSAKPAKVEALWKSVEDDLDTIIVHHVLPADLVPPPLPAPV